MISDWPCVTLTQLTQAPMGTEPTVLDDDDDDDNVRVLEHVSRTPHKFHTWNSQMKSG